MTTMVEPYHSLANQLEAGVMARKSNLSISSRKEVISEYSLMSPLKSKVYKLNDASVFKILEQVMDEMIHVDAHAFDLGTQMLSYGDYLYKYLMTKYGLSQLA